MKRKKEEDISKTAPKKQKKDSTLEQPNYSFQALIEAIKNKETMKVLELITRIDKEVINDATWEGWTALHFAAKEGQEEVCAQLIPKLEQETINAGVTIDEFCSNKTALHFAAEGGYKKICKLILNASPEAIDNVTMGLCSGKTALHFAAEEGQEEICEMLLRIKPEIIDDVDVEGWTALHFAAESGHEHICEMLLEKNPDAAINTDGGVTVLMAAAFGGHEDICKMLVPKMNHEAINAVIETGTVLHYAALGGDKGVCQLLIPLMNPGVINIVDQFGNTALHCVANPNNKKVSENQRKEICQVLIDNMHMSKLAGLLNQSKTNLHILNMVSGIITDFIGKNFSNNEINLINLDGSGRNLLKLYQIVDKVNSLKHSADKPDKKNSDLCINKVNGYITKYYFKLVGVCESINKDSPISILVSSDDCMTHVLGFLSPSLLAEHFTVITSLIGAANELPADNTDI
jgi:ankyrin repeat protein